MGYINHDKAHAVDKGNPKVDGPYLDDIRRDQERAYRARREAAINAAAAIEEVEEEEVEEEETQPSLFVVQPSPFVVGNDNVSSTNE